MAPQECFYVSLLITIVAAAAAPGSVSSALPLCAEGLAARSFSLPAGGSHPLCRLSDELVAANLAASSLAAPVTISITFSGAASSSIDAELRVLADSATAAHTSKATTAIPAASSLTVSPAPIAAAALSSMGLPSAIVKSFTPLLSLLNAGLRATLTSSALGTLAQRLHLLPPTTTLAEATSLFAHLTASDTVIDHAARLDPTSGPSRHLTLSTFKSACGVSSPQNKSCAVYFSCAAVGSSAACTIESATIDRIISVASPSIRSFAPQLLTVSTSSTPVKPSSTSAPFPTTSPRPERHERDKAECRSARAHRRELQSFDSSLTLNSLVAVRVGDGITPLSAAAAPIFLDELAATPGSWASGPLQTMAVDPSDGTLSGTDTTQGSITRTANGQYAELGAVKVPVGTPPGSSPPYFASGDRVVLELFPSGYVSAAVTMPATSAVGGYDGIIKGVCSDDGLGYWIVGNGTFPFVYASLREDSGWAGNLTVAGAARADFFTSCVINQAHPSAAFTMYLTRTQSLYVYVDQVAMQPNGDPPESGQISFQANGILRNSSFAINFTPYYGKTLVVNRLATKFFVADPIANNVYCGTTFWPGPSGSPKYPMPAMIGSSLPARIVGLALSWDEALLYVATTAAIYSCPPCTTSLCCSSPTFLTSAPANTEYRGLTLSPQDSCFSRYDCPSCAVAFASSKPCDWCAASQSCESPEADSTCNAPPITSSATCPTPSPSPSPAAPSTRPTPTPGLQPPPIGPKPFLLNSLILLRVGDGSVAGGTAISTSTSAAKLSLEERSPKNYEQPIQVIPITGAVLSGSDPTVGQLSRSVDGRFVSFGAIAASPGTPAGTSAPFFGASSARVVARIASDGTVDTTTSMPASSAVGGFDGIPRAACSVHGDGFWVVGNNSAGSVVYVPFGAKASSAVLSFQGERDSRAFRPLLSTQYTGCFLSAAPTPSGSMSGDLFLVRVNDSAPNVYVDKVANTGSGGGAAPPTKGSALPLDNAELGGVGLGDAALTNTPFSNIIIANQDETVFYMSKPDYSVYCDYIYVGSYTRGISFGGDDDGHAGLSTRSMKQFSSVCSFDEGQSTAVTGMVLSSNEELLYFTTATALFSCPACSSTGAASQSCKFCSSFDRTQKRLAWAPANYEYRGLALAPAPPPSSVPAIPAGFIKSETCSETYRMGRGYTEWTVPALGPSSGAACSLSFNYATVPVIESIAISNPTYSLLNVYQTQGAACLAPVASYSPSNEVISSDSEFGLYNVDCSSSTLNMTCCFAIDHLDAQTTALVTYTYAIYSNPRPLAALILLALGAAAAIGVAGLSCCCCLLWGALHVGGCAVCSCWARLCPCCCTDKGGRSCVPGKDATKLTAMAPGSKRGSAFGEAVMPGGEEPRVVVSQQFAPLHEARSAAFAAPPASSAVAAAQHGSR